MKTMCLVQVDIETHVGCKQPKLPLYEVTYDSVISYDLIKDFKNVLVLSFLHEGHEPKCCLNLAK